MMINKKFFLNYLNSLYPNTKCFLNYTQNFQLLIAVILSAQTTDFKVNQVTSILFNKYDTILKLATADYNDIYKILLPLGLAKNKTNNIIETCKILHFNMNDIIPNDRTNLMSLPGVGYKTASVILGELYNQNVIPVDTHIKRISKRLGLSNNINPNLIEQDLEKLFKDHGINLHRQLILFGRNICKAKSPLCDICKLNNHCLYFSENTN